MVRTNQKENSDLLVGSEAKMMLKNPEEHHLRDSRISEFFDSVRKYFETVVKYLLDKLPLKDPLLEAAVVADLQAAASSNTKPAGVLPGTISSADPCQLQPRCTS